MPTLQLVSETTLTELTLLLLAFILSAIIGLERARRLKSAGLRTHALVGLGSALFTIVSAYGFHGLIGEGVGLDPSRIAAQIVSGVGFLGAGVIFVRGNTVTGLTTAATIWVTAAVGMACGAGLPIPAIMTTAIHLLVVRVFGRLGGSGRSRQATLVARVVYKKDRGALREVLAAATALGYTAALESARTATTKNGREVVHTVLTFSGGGRDPQPLLRGLAEIRGVLSVRPGDDGED